MEPQGIELTMAERLLAEEEDCEVLVEDLLDGEVAVKEEYQKVLAECARLRISERELWQRMALYGKKGMVIERGTYPFDPGYGDVVKLRQRILTLIGKLPYDSLDDFRGLVALTSSFLKRVEFVCDLVVYLFAEREKGEKREEVDTRVYTQFFTNKLMWELDMIRQFADTKTLRELNQEFVCWLEDRIIDGEVLV